VVVLPRFQGRFANSAQIVDDGRGQKKPGHNLPLICVNVGGRFYLRLDVIQLEEIGEGAAGNLRRFPAVEAERGKKSFYRVGKK